MTLPQLAILALLSMNNARYSLAPLFSHHHHHHYYSQLDMIMNSILIQMIHLIINLHNRRLIPTPITIIRSRKHRHHRPIVLPLIPLHDELMRSSDEV